MASLTVRKLTESTHSLLGERAKRHNRSLEAEARDILDRAARTYGRTELMASFAELDRLPQKTPPSGMSAVELVRAERDAW